MSGAESVDGQNSGAGPRDVEAAPLLHTAEEDHQSPENMLRTNRGSYPAPSSKQCRICMEEESDSAANPLISPCKCSGSTRYVHRQCLLKWRTMKEGTHAYYRCEICHYRYQFRRLWWAHLLGHPITSALIFACVMVVSSWMLGYVPLVELLIGVPAGSNLGLHFLDGLILVGLIGALLMLVGLCSGGPAPIIHTCNGCCEPCPVMAVAGGEECLVLLALFLVSLVLAGLVYVCKSLYGALYSTLRDRMRWAEHMVENVGGEGKSDGGRSPGDGGATSAAGRRGGRAAGTTSSGASASTSSRAGPSSSSVAVAVAAGAGAGAGAGVATKAPPEESMV